MEGHGGEGKGKEAKEDDLCFYVLWFVVCVLRPGLTPLSPTSTPPQVWYDENIQPRPFVAVEDYDELPSYRHDYEIGTLVVHSGMELHTIPPEEDPQETDYRITLQGWGVYSEGRWVIFS
jgi:hypothetical protein